MTAIVVTVGGWCSTAEIADQPPLGGRVWSLAGFAGDPLDPYAIRGASPRRW